MEKLTLEPGLDTISATMGGTQPDTALHEDNQTNCHTAGHRYNHQGEKLHKGTDTEQTNSE